VKIRDHLGNELDLNVRTVDSSNVSWVGWPKSGEQLIVVQFDHGGRYAYLGASRQQAVALANAKTGTGVHSVGSYLHKVIKKKYEAVKIG
jgi:hypothetical protein